MYTKLNWNIRKTRGKNRLAVYTKDPENPLIRDLMIEGLSLARTQKEEFNSIIVNNDGSIDALFENLSNFIENK